MVAHLQIGVLSCGFIGGEGSLQALPLLTLAGLSSSPPYVPPSGDPCHYGDQGEGLSFLSHAPSWGPCFLSG